MAMSDNTCDKCFHVEQLPTGDCTCLVDFIEVKADDVSECFVSRSEMFDNENMIDFDD